MATLLAASVPACAPAGPDGLAPPETAAAARTAEMQPASAPRPATELALDATPSLTPGPFSTPAAGPTPSATTRPQPPAATATPRPAATVPPKVLLNLTHEYQKWNNCGPVSLGVVASYFGIPRTQFDIAGSVKGNENDKNVEPAEMQAYLTSQGLRAIVRINGTRDQMVRLLAAGFPVIVHQWLAKPGGDLVGHYRVIQGYDIAAGVFVTSDPYTPPRKAYAFADFEAWWAPWNHRYIVAYKPEQETMVSAALGEDFDAAANRRRALVAANAAVQALPRDAALWFNLGEDRLASGDARGAVEAYDTAAALGMPVGFAWYNFGPYDALYRTGAYQRILDLTTPQMKSLDLIEEVHYWRGMAYRALGQPDRAREEFAAAVQLNPNYADARAKLEPSR